MGAKPKVLKLYQIKARLENKLEAQGRPLPYGGGNPYFYCPKCNRSMVEVSYLGHYGGCEVKSLEDKIKALSKEIEAELSDFIISGEVNSVSFRNYQWQKQDIFVPQLDKLLRDIEDFCKERS